MKESQNNIPKITCDKMIIKISCNVRLCDIKERIMIVRV